MIGPTKDVGPTMSCHAPTRFVVLHCSGFQAAIGVPNSLLGGHGVLLTPRLSGAID